MSNPFTLEDLNRAIETKYAPFVFQAGRNKFVFSQVLRLDESKKDVVKAQLELLEENQADLTAEEAKAILKAVLENVLESGNQDKLWEAVGDDILKITVLFEEWVKSSQPGEA